MMMMTTCTDTVWRAHAALLTGKILGGSV